MTGEPAQAGPERVGQNLNRGLATLLAGEPGAYLIGEDLADPYGGAFKTARGLSTRFPRQVVSTPISENAMVGIGAGLALAGRPTIVEIMFGDFVLLGLDPLVNFAAKSVSMYGRRVAVPLVVRCPSGGGRGYGPTHSQSLQKHLIGVPDLAVYELSPFRDAGELLIEMMAREAPSVLFESKALYGNRMRTGSVVDGLFVHEPLAGGQVARISPGVTADVDAVVVSTGGASAAALAAIRVLLLEHEIACQLLVPSVLYPVPLEPLLSVAGLAGVVVVVEESTAGGTWGAEVAHQVHQHLWGHLRHPVRLVHTPAQVSPGAPHLEQEALVTGASVVDAVLTAIKGV